MHPLCLYLYVQDFPLQKSTWLLLNRPSLSMCKKQLKEFIELPSSAAALSTPWPLCGLTNPQLASCFRCIHRILYHQLQHSLQGSLQILFRFLNFLFEIDLPFLWAFLFSFDQPFYFLKAFLHHFHIEPCRGFFDCFVLSCGTIFT